jgi:hypothetical protein
VLRHILQAVLLVGRGGHGALADGFGGECGGQPEAGHRDAEQQGRRNEQFFMI